MSEQNFQRGTVGGAKVPSITPNFRRGHVDVPEAPAVEEPKPYKVNQYAGRCPNCGVWVEKEQGRVDNVDGKWVVSHVLPCPDIATDAAAVTPEFLPNVVNGETLYDGKYTLERLDGHRTFRLRTQSTDSDFMPGAQIIEYLAGSDNTRDYVRFGHIKGGRLSVWKRFRENGDLVADAEAFMAAPQEALASVACYRCGRDLTVPASVHNGLGPECVKKGV